jgi:hypothetical protein
VIGAFILLIALAMLLVIRQDDLDPPDFPNTPPLPEGAR